MCYLHSKIRAAVCIITAFTAKTRPIVEKGRAAITPRVACPGVINTDSSAGMGGVGAIPVSEHLRIITTPGIRFQRPIVSQ